MSVAAVRNQPLCLCNRFIKIFRSIQCKHRRQLFMRKSFFQFHTLHFTDQNLRRRLYLESADLRDLRCALPHDLSIQRTVNNHRIADFIFLLIRQNMASALDKFRFHRIINSIFRNHRLLRCTNKTIVKRLRMNNRIDRYRNIRRFINNGRRISRTHAESRFARTVRTAHHAGAARRKDNVRRFHQSRGHIQ